MATVCATWLLNFSVRVCMYAQAPHCIWDGLLRTVRPGRSAVLRDTPNRHLRVTKSGVTLGDLREDPNRPKHTFPYIWLIVRAIVPAASGGRVGGSLLTLGGGKDHEDTLASAKVGWRWVTPMKTSSGLFHREIEEKLFGQLFQNCGVRFIHTARPSLCSHASHKQRFFPTQATVPKMWLAGRYYETRECRTFFLGL